MIEIKQDKKSPTWIINVQDSLGYHKQVNLTFDDMCELYKQIGHIFNDIKHGHNYHNTLEQRSDVGTAGNYRFEASAKD